MDELILSSLPHTWIIDLDGTIVKHNGDLIDGYDTILSESVAFLSSLPDEDRIIILTARSFDRRDRTISFLNENHVRYDDILFGMPVGERVLINDSKPSGLTMSYAIDVKRDSGIILDIEINTHL